MPGRRLTPRYSLIERLVWHLGFVPYHQYTLDLATAHMETIRARFAASLDKQSLTEAWDWASKNWMRTERERVELERRFRAAVRLVAERDRHHAGAKQRIADLFVALNRKQKQIDELTADKAALQHQVNDLTRFLHTGR